MGRAAYQTRVVKHLPRHERQRQVRHYRHIYRAAAQPPRWGDSFDADHGTAYIPKTQARRIDLPSQNEVGLGHLPRRNKTQVLLAAT